MYRLIIVLVTLSACAQAPGLSEERAPVLTLSLDPIAVVTDNRVTANEAASHRIAVARITPTQWEGRPTLTIVSSNEGRALFSLLIGCALPQDQSLIVGEFEFFGETGLTPGWLHHRLDKQERGWISSCIFAHLSRPEVALPISMRGTKLHTDADERADFPVQEGAFFGELFTPLDQQVGWWACQGEGLLTVPLPGGLFDRDCAKQDPSHPDLTLCGFNFAGDCSTVCDASRRHCSGFGEVITTYVNL